MTLLVLLASGVVLPSVRSGSFTADVSAMTTVVVCALVGGTILGMGDRKE
ncbi:hypothetical protein [Saccharothrix algeriensis]|uniref:Uncharacterized protein n=1 Tax=Saccharothrix algeriensis TaxID=173560 RepID=A0A8T8I308_9PSEU|nr:hypothetical protein [Saccharothrix algeriensis]MBM7811227.1 hypothetical protein [Saccharothrix algeriensis]QTR05136.1 hypothetical protein J7S33_10765 [Saccharothrix algeriensis]